MKVYFHLNLKGFSNCYVVVNENTHEAIIIDPGKITDGIISQIEEQHLKLTAVLVTHNHGSHVDGIKTLQKIYNVKVYAADWEVAKKNTNVLMGDGKLYLAKMPIRYFSMPGHTTDSIVYKIGNLIFTGDVLFAGSMGSTNSSYSEVILRTGIENNIFSQLDSVILMPGHGPPSTIEASRIFTMDIE